MAKYLIEKRNDDYYIINGTGTTSVTVEVYKLLNCDDYVKQYDVTIPIGGEERLDAKEDGTYKIVDTSTNPDSVHYIRYYPNLENALIESLYSVLCGEDCKDCNNQEIKECDLLMARAQMDAYKRLIYPDGNQFFKNVYEETNCLLNSGVQCSTNEYILTGGADCNKKLIKQLLALDYISLYLYRYNQNLECTTCDELYIKDKFKIEEVMCCITDISIDFKKIKDKIENLISTFKIIIGQYINQPPNVVGDYSTNLLNRGVLTITSSMFTTSTTPVYADPEGDAPEAVKIDSLPTSGQLLLNNVVVNVGDIISISDINSGLLTYEAPNQDAAVTVTFNFSVSDTGSHQFTS